MLTAHALSHIGRVRKTNEDAFLSDLELGLFCVADGMGGHNAGEVASHLALEVIHEFLLNTIVHDASTWPFGLDARLSFDANRLATAVRLANRQVFREAETRDEYSGMGTTVVAALVRGAVVTYVCVGDSRIYSFNDGRLTQLTRDDSWVDTVLGHERGAADASLARHPMRHVLTNSVGVREELVVDVAERELAPGELLLFSSDGLHGLIDDAVIAGVLRANRSLEAAARCLIQAALDRGGTDNLTALLVRRDSDDETAH